MTRVLGVLVLVALTSLPAAPARAGEQDQAMYGKALQFLLKNQHANGSFGQVPGQPPGEVGITALVVKALADAPESFRAQARPAAEKAAAWMLAQQQEDGSFSPARSGLSTYRTALSITALSALDRAKYREQVARAATWLKADQYDEKDGVNPDSPYYGGYGYDERGAKPGADMSNTIMALEALKEAGISPDDPVFKRALKFLERSQNNSETNPGVGGLKPKDDGGFIYDPGLDRNKSAMTENADGTRSFESYASMTYGGLMSLLYAGATKEDPRVQAALRWISNNYTLEENYGLGTRQQDPKAAQQGLYYYYYVFAKSLDALGMPTLKTAQGERRWARDLCDALLARQGADGSFKNAHDRWWESDPVLVTAYVLNALNDALPRLEK